MCIQYQETSIMESTEMVNCFITYFLITFSCNRCVLKDMSLYSSIVLIDVSL